MDKKHLAFSGIERSDSGLKLLGKKQRSVDFSELSGPATAGKLLGFSAISLPIKGGDEFKIVGIKAADAKRFVSAVNDTFCQYVAKKYAAVEGEFIALGKAIDLLKQPHRYPAACLLTPFVDRASIAAKELPSVIPEGSLSAKQQSLIINIVSFAEDPQRTRKAAIAAFVDIEIKEQKQFFDTIESNPLTPEQRLAVVTDEDATLVLAGAGSGKTSVIVSKTAYIVKKGIRKPKEILLMAFAKKAAAEMAERIKKLSGSEVDALTFHALGNRIIREVEGRGPALAAHASDDVKFRALLRKILFDEVAKAGLGDVIMEWFAEYSKPYKSEWDFESKDQYYQWVKSHELRTLNGDLVKSFEEWEISNWLYRNGIDHEYEPVYEHDPPVDARGAYKPDFRLTESGVYIEHFGVRRSRGLGGSTRLTTPCFIDREKYLEDMEWKRRVHGENGTPLIETFSYEKVEGRLLSALKDKLERRGVSLNPIPEDRLFDKLSEMGQTDGFTQTLGTFLRLFKSSGTSIHECRAKGDQGEEGRRNRAFLQVFEPLLKAYQKRLGNEIDFEDMINRATEHVEAGRFQSPYRHLLVDEFQDISEGQARLLRALKAQHADARIFAVGDDWQSIFRFAGSDIHLMHDFGREFGGRLGSESGVHRTIDLGRTFRNVDKIALPARRFVLRNPSQIEKKVITATSAEHPAIRVAYYDRDQDRDSLKAVLAELSGDATSQTSVLLLGRYKFLKPENLKALESEHPKISLRFMTAHASKGLEADHVVILRAEESDTMGFPSEIADDPLLGLVLPKPENFDHAEERRLFYVALTRARKSVTILADRSSPSVFVRELVGHPEYETIVLGEQGIADVQQCVSCGGRMLARTGKTGKVYFSCEYHPLCDGILWPCTACGKNLPATKKADPDMKVCSCGAEFPACPECAEGWLVEREGPYGKFLGCVRYSITECRGRKNLS